MKKAQEKSRDLGYVFFSTVMHIYMCFVGPGMVYWWECSSPTNVTKVGFLHVWAGFVIGNVTVPSLTSIMSKLQAMYSQCNRPTHLLTQACAITVSVILQNIQNPFQGPRFVSKCLVLHIVLLICRPAYSWKLHTQDKILYVYVPYPISIKGRTQQMFTLFKQLHKISCIRLVGIWMMAWGWMIKLKHCSLTWVEVVKS